MRSRARLADAKVWQCMQCQLTMCDPLPHIDSPSAGASSILTEESFTQATLRYTDAQRARFDQLARGRHALYSRDLGSRTYRILEIGCGAGGLGGPMRRAGVDYEGVDLDHRPVDAARRRGEGAWLTVGDFMDDSFTGTWDVVFATQVLEHITRPITFMNKIAASLTPGGIVHLDVPSHSTLAGVPSRLFGGIGGRFGAIDWPHHAIAYNAASLKRMLQERYAISIFTASPDDALWGQAVVPRVALRAYYRASRVTHRESLLVAYGRRRPDLQEGVMPNTGASAK
jgi:SAM-dependent methyltransferase